MRDNYRRLNTMTRVLAKKYAFQLDREDMHQSLLVKALELDGKSEGEIFMACKHEAISIQRKERNRGKIIPISPEVDYDLPVERSPERESTMEEFWSSLTEFERFILIGLIAGEMGCHLAKMVGVSPATFSRARARLKTKAKSYFFVSTLSKS